MKIIGRRQMLWQSGAAASAILLAGQGLSWKTALAQQVQKGLIKNNRLRQSVARWPFGKIPFPDFCRAVAEMGLTAIDLLDETEWATAQKFGLTCSLAWAPKVVTIADGLNNKANHEKIIASLEKTIPQAAKFKIPNVIAFFGNRRGMSDAEATENCIAGLNRIKQIGEDHGVTICVELLNSKVDHKDYQGDHTAFGVNIIKAVASPRVKLLYDIYHMQIMEGDIIRTIRDNHEYIAHFHTGGVPGRHELDGTQELNWATVCKAIVETGYTGYVAHEFVPTRDPLTSLREAVTLCDV